jgi:copper oxidase (laccase) domain-containing protein
VPDIGASVCEVDQQQWPRSVLVQACFTTRHGDFNLAPGAGGERLQASLNRHRLQKGLGLQRPPAWLRQVHGTRIVEAGSKTSRVRTAAGAARPGRPVW